jgi:hypothetical protein
MPSKGTNHNYILPANFRSPRRAASSVRLEEVTRSKDATGHRADRRTDKGTLQAGIVTVTSVALNHGAKISAGK